MKDLTVYVHGKDGLPEKAEHYRVLFHKEEQTRFLDDCLPRGQS